ncbi:MAG: hypothetical protein KAQ91_04605 [Methylococcales bacterium]|nr:hypothetical protein [Methylococcales bacterium]
MNTIPTHRKHEDHLQDYDGLAHLMYLMQAISFLFGGIPFVIAVFLNYVNMHHVKGTWLESHYKWQLETFWVGLLLVLIGLITTPFLIGFGVLFIASAWAIYRIFYGLFILNKSKEVTTISKFPFI